MIIVVFRPCRTSWSRSAWPYHFDVAPPQPAISSSWLNELITTATSGSQRNASTSAARAALTGCAARTLTSLLQRLAAPHDEEQDQQDAHQRDGERRAERVVAGVLELVGEDVADHQRLAAAEDLGDHVLAERRDADDDRAGDHAGHRQRQHDPAELPPGRRAEIGGGAVDRVVDALERDVDRQHHQRQVRVDDADRDRGGRVQDEGGRSSGRSRRRAGRSARGSAAGRPTSTCAR